jgi:hypothetical protein
MACDGVYKKKIIYNDKLEKIFTEKCLDVITKEIKDLKSKEMI